MMSKALIHGLAEATSNIAFGSTLWPPTHRTPRALQGKQSYPSPYPSRDRRAPPPQAPLVIAPQSSGGAQASGVPPKIVYMEPYYPWTPTKAQLWDCHDMLRGRGGTESNWSASMLTTHRGPKTENGPASSRAAPEF